MPQRFGPISALPCAYGKYELLEHIGTGGMAEIYRARQRGVGGQERVVVVKRLREKHALDDDIQRLFVEEAKLAAQVHHRNVVRVYELDRTEAGELFISMEFIRGTDLRRLLEHAARADREMSAPLAVFVVRELLQALAFVHALKDPAGRPRDLVHCDVTPENILVSREGEVKLADFGVAVDATRAEDPLADRAKGKLPYMSPEQILEQTVDARSDVYSAGVVLWEALTRRRLFPGRTPSEVMAQICASPRPPPSRFAPGISPALDGLVLRAIDPELERRFQSALELEAALAALPEARERASGSFVASREILSLLDAPVVRPEAQGFEPAEDDGHDELEAIDRAHDALDAHFPPIEAPLDAPVLGGAYTRPDESTPRPHRVGENLPDPRSLAQTRPRMPAVRPPPAEVGEDGSTYRIIRERSPSSPDPWAAESDADAILQAYLADMDSEPQPGREATPWTHAHITPAPVLGGAAPLWIRRGAELTGPSTPSEALDALEAFTRGGQRDAIPEMSADRRGWLTPAAVARLLGESLMSATPDPQPRLERGRFEERSLVELLGQLGRAQRTGRLELWADHDAERVELHLLTGSLTHINWSSAPFEVWRSLLDDPFLGAEGLPEAFGLAISTGSPLPGRLPASALEQYDTHRQLHARRRFERALGWTRGGWLFDPSATVSVSERGQPILRLLPGMTYCALSPEELDRRLGPRLGRAHLIAPELPALKDPLGLTDDELECLRGLGGHEPLGTLVKRAEATTDGKFVRAMAYVLGELGLLNAR